MDKKIRIIAGGPYEVSQGVPLTAAFIEADADGTSQAWREGKAYEDGSKPYYLCRCGKSARKPYCDGTHGEIGFEGTERATHGADEANTKVYEGARVDLVDEESLCASMRFCDARPDVWTACVESDREGFEEAGVREACNCASGRLTVRKKDGTPIEPDLEQEISPIQDTVEGWRGPLWVKGGVQLIGADGRKYRLRNRMTICRCGLSNNMPFCDISHFNNEDMRGFDK